MDPLLSELLEAARSAREKAYAPYSRYLVGAAVRTGRGEIFSGANIENSCYGLSICAERVAASCAIGKGERRFAALAVASSSDEPPVPCGACLQFLAEFSPAIPIVTSGATGEVLVTSLAELLPKPFKL